MLKHRPTFLQNALLLSKTTAENCFLKKKHLCNHALAQTCKNSISLILNVGSFLKHPLLNCNARLGTDRSSNFLACYKHLYVLDQPYNCILRKHISALTNKAFHGCFLYFLLSELWGCRLMQGKALLFVLVDNTPLVVSKGDCFNTPQSAQTSSILYHRLPGIELRH